jgi:hypothetical protein
VWKNEEKEGIIIEPGYNKIGKRGCLIFLLIADILAILFYLN